MAGSLPGPLPTRRCLSPSLALSSLNKHTEAVAYYKKALELDPDNETYKSNLKIAELKLREAPSPVSGPGEGSGREWECGPVSLPGFPWEGMGEAGDAGLGQAR